MVGIRKQKALAFILLCAPGLAIQVAPNSPCAAKCLDSSSQDSSSETLGADLVCKDLDYNTTAVGQKYQECVSCLQTSPFSAQNQNDQEWFLYNLRFTLAACLFDFVNTTDSGSSPCLTDTTCGPLQAALEDGNLLPANTSEYAYCTADQNALRSTYYPNCVQCLRTTSDQQYLANFLVALNAGCDQQPAPGLIIGLEGSVFSSFPVNGTYPGYGQNSTSSTSTSHHGMSQGAVIGTAVGLVVLFIITIAVLFICFRKRQVTNRLRALNSPLHSRFGADNITSPIDGGYGNPYSRQHNKAAEPFDPSALSKKELTVLSNARSVIAKHETDPSEKPPTVWQNTHAHLANKLPEYTGSAIPTHQAYIPSHKRDSLHSGTTLADNAYQTSKYPSSRSSPKDIISASPSSSPNEIIPTSTESSPKATIPTSTESSPKAAIPPKTTFPSKAALPLKIRTSPKIPPPIQVPGSYNNTPLRQQPEAHIQPISTSPEFEESSRIMPRGMHSERVQANPDSRRPSSRTRSRSRSASRTRAWRRTLGFGIGNSNASDEARPAVRISGPVFEHTGRFDFEMADREREFKEQQRMKDASPDSTNSDELWPGNY